MSEQRALRAIAIATLLALIAAFLFTCARDAQASTRHPLTRDQADGYALEAGAQITFDPSLDGFENTDSSVCCAKHVSPNRWSYRVHVHVTGPGSHRYLARAFVTWWAGRGRPVVSWRWVSGHSPLSSRLPLVVAPDPEVEP